MKIGIAYWVCTGDISGLLDIKLPMVVDGRGLLIPHSVVLAKQKESPRCFKSGL
jgi:hypothetical protein